MSILLMPVIVLLGAILAASPKVLANPTYTSSSYNSASSNIYCVNVSTNTGVRPSPYTGGAGILRVFYPPDGSTVTVTTTGAVIKQSPCNTPYRQGWVNPANLNCLNSYSDLSAQIKPGASNPYVNSGSSNCVTQANTVTPTPTRPTGETTATLPASTPQAVSTTTTVSATSTGKAAALPNTGPGGMLALGGVSTVLGALGHFFYIRRRA